MPDLQFPVDTSGQFLISRDFKAYSSKAISSDLKSLLAGVSELPNKVVNQEVFSGTLVGNSPKHTKMERSLEIYPNYSQQNLLTMELHSDSVFLEKLA